MTEPTGTMGFAVACKRFFGLKAGEKVGEFAQEIKSLTLQDRMELAQLLSKELNVDVSLNTLE